jgi:hypothetical protein
MTLTAKEPGTAPEPVAEPPQAPGDRSSPPTSGANSGQVWRLLLALVLITAVFIVAGLGDLLLFIAILIVIVMLHELGHFATAKWSGMKVTEYFVGFGPRLWSVKRGETEYGVKAIPAGGYVRITGFTVLEDVAEEDEPRAYRQQPFWKRIIVGSAGSAMHFLIAFALALISVFAFGVATDNVKIGAIEHWSGVAQTPAQQAGLRAGDVIVSVNGHRLTDPNSVAPGHRGDAQGRPGRQVGQRRACPALGQDGAGLHRHQRGGGHGVGQPDPGHRRRRHRTGTGHVR